MILILQIISLIIFVIAFDLEFDDPFLIMIGLVLFAIFWPLCLIAGIVKLIVKFIRGKTK